MQGARPGAYRPAGGQSVRLLKAFAHSVIRPPAHRTGASRTRAAMPPVRRQNRQSTSPAVRAGRSRSLTHSVIGEQVPGSNAWRRPQRQFARRPRRTPPREKEIARHTYRARIVPAPADHCQAVGSAVAGSGRNAAPGDLRRDERRAARADIGRHARYSTPSATKDQQCIRWAERTFAYLVKPASWQITIVRFSQPRGLLTSVCSR